MLEESENSGFRPGRSVMQCMVLTAAFPAWSVPGTPGCYSLCTGLGKYWDGELSILPGIGSMSYLAAKLQLPWQDWKVVSAHGRACDPVAAVTEIRKYFF